MHCLYTNYTSNNPAGIEINLGYYALCECIVKGTWASTALSRWCGVWNDKLKPRKKYELKKPFQKPMGEKTKRILRIYSKHPEMKNTQIAKLAKCTPEMVGRVLHGIGVRKNKWEGYKEAVVVGIYENNPTLQTREIAEIAGCTPEAVRRILRKMGIKKKNRWDGYISKDPRYSKDKRGK
jgi:DNA-binding MarR family transcriptional regulator